MAMQITQSYNQQPNQQATLNTRCAFSARPQEFEDVACDIARFLFWCGARMEANTQSYRSLSVSLAVPGSKTENATHMLSVRGLLPQELEKVVQ